MAFNYVKPTAKFNTPATQVIPGRTDMAANDGGGVSFKISKWEMLDRFLIIGAAEGTYYVSKEKNQVRNVDNVVECIKEDGARVVNRIFEVSDKGLSSKNDHAVYALALCFAHGNEETKLVAESVLSKVCRTGTHILMFVSAIKSLRGFGKRVRSAINSWYKEKDTKSLAFQLSKYQQREGWSHKDVFRLSHPSFGKLTNVNKIAQWSMGKLEGSKFANCKDEGLKLLWAIDKVKGLTNVKEVIKYIEEYSLQREHLPTELLNKPEIQEHLLNHMGATALMRNLGNMSKSGLLKPLSSATKLVVSKLTDREFIKKGRLHPLSLLVAQRTYSSGRGLLGKSSWDVNQSVSDALEQAFYLSFDLVEPTGKNFFFGLDISGSMTSRMDSGVSCNEVAAVMALTMMKIEPWTFVGGFGSTFVPLTVSKTDNLQTAARKCQGNFGSTNPSSAIEYAINKKLDVDTFVFITDNDINTGFQPSEVLKKYRNVMKKPNCKMIVCGLTSSNFSIADPKDPRMLDVAGFTPDLTSLICDFSR